MSFDATNFPLQKAAEDAKLDVSAPSGGGPDQLPDEGRIYGSEMDDYNAKEKIDLEFMELIGEDPGDFTYEEKYRQVVETLFGEVDEEDVHQLFQVDEGATNSKSDEASGKQGGAREGEQSEPAQDSQVPEDRCRRATCGSASEVSFRT